MRVRVCVRVCAGRFLHCLTKPKYMHRGFWVMTYSMVFAITGWMYLKIRQLISVLLMGCRPPIVFFLNLDLNFPVLLMGWRPPLAPVSISPNLLFSRALSFPLPTPLPAASLCVYPSSAL